MARLIDLNCDMGEGFGAYKIGLDEEVIRFISSANVACGFHAGDPNVMYRTTLLARENGVAVGVHAGFPDLVGFGRRNMVLDPSEIRNDLIYQIGALQAFCKVHGFDLQHVKPHGALYNMATVDAVMAEAVAEGIAAVDRNLILFCLRGSELEKAARAKGLVVACEVFADRAFNPDGTLVSRSKPNAVIKDPEVAAKRAVRMVIEGKVTAINGEDIEVEADTMCVHGDNPAAIALVETIREEFKKAGIEVRPVHTFLEGVENRTTRKVT